MDRFIQVQTTSALFKTLAKPFEKLLNDDNIVVMNKFPLSFGLISKLTKEKKNHK